MNSTTTLYGIVRLIACIGIILYSNQIIYAQIINIESRRMATDTTGWAGDIGIAVSASKNALSYFTFNGKGHLQFKTENDIWLGIVDYNMVHAGGEDFGKSGFGHLRYNRKLSQLVRFEVFTQGQFNEVSKIDVRYLNGVGFRFKLSQFERAKFYYGITYMNEYEEIIDEAVINKDHRLSSYFSFTLAPEKGITLSNTTYIQPLFNDFQDYRLSNDTRLYFKITGRLNFVTTFHYLYDANPPVDIPNSNYQVDNGLTYGF